MEKEWVDFKAVKAVVTMQMVLDHYTINGLKKVGEDLRGKCPIHKSSGSAKHLSVNLSKNAFKCFAETCGARGNVLDFVAAMEKCSVREAALRMQAWFKVGEHADLKNSETAHSFIDTVGAIVGLIDEIHEHCSEIASHVSKVEAKATRLKEVVATLRNSAS